MDIVSKYKDADVKQEFSFKKVCIYNSFMSTEELAQSLLYTLRTISECPWNIEMVSEYDLHTEDILYIIVCPRSALGYNVAYPKIYIAYQLEPTYILNRYYYRQMLSNAYCVWDYSDHNAKILKNMGINAFYVPVKYTPYISSNNILNGTQIYDDSYKDIDVLFLAYDAYPRRQKIKNDLIKTGIKYVAISDLKIDGMKDVIKRAKICLNLHSMDNNNCLEILRLNILLSNQACVVSEDCNTDFDYSVNEFSDYVHFCKYDDIVSECVKLVNDFERRRKLAHKSYSWYSMNNWITTLK